MGGFGGGGQQQAQAPQLNVGKTLKLNRGQLKLLNEYAPILAQTLGDTSRSQNTQNTLYGLDMLTRPNQTLRQEQIAPIRQRLRNINNKIDDLQQELGKAGGKRKNEIRQEIRDLRNRAKNQRGRIEDIRESQPLQQLTNAFRKEFKQRDNLIGAMQKSIGSSDEYGRLQTALGQGLTAQTVGMRQAAPARADAAQMGNVANVQAREIAASRMGNFGQAESRDISAEQVGAGALGSTLMSRAMERANSTGTLSAEASRDAVQSARQGMAARGLATGSAGLAAELLNRDRYSRQRMEEDLAFAQGVQAQDLGRQFQNVGNQLAASQSNQSAQMQAELANLQARYNSAVQQGDWEQAAAIQNQDAALRADLANQQTAFNTGQFNAANQQQANLANMQAANNMSQFNTELGARTDQFNALQRTDSQRYNVGLLGQSAMLADQERARKLGTRQDIYNFSLSSNPRMMLAGLGSPYANMTQNANASVTGLTANVTPQYSGGQLSSGGWLQNAMLGASIGMSEGSMFGPWGAAGGALFGGIDGAAGGPIFKAKTGQ